MMVSFDYESSTRLIPNSKDILINVGVQKSNWFEYENTVVRLDLSEENTYLTNDFIEMLGYRLHSPINVSLVLGNLIMENVKVLGGIEKNILGRNVLNHLSFLVDQNRQKIYFTRKIESCAKTYLNDSNRNFTIGLEYDKLLRCVPNAVIEKFSLDTDEKKIDWMIKSRYLKYREN